MADLLDLAFRVAFVLDTDGAAACALVGCHVACVCVGVCVCVCVCGEVVTVRVIVVVMTRERGEKVKVDVYHGRT